MKRCFFLIILIFFCTGFTGDYISVDELEGLFKKSLPKNENIVYNKVPRGLIISIDEKLLFDECNTCMKESSLPILDSIAEILKNLPNRCIIEDHIQNLGCSSGLEDWEISMIRAANISEYLVKYKNVPTEKLFDIGFGGTAPDESQSKCDNITGCAAPININRIDFVIIEYEAKR